MKVNEYCFAGELRYQLFIIRIVQVVVVLVQGYDGAPDFGRSLVYQLVYLSRLQQAYYPSWG